MSEPQPPKELTSDFGIPVEHCASRYAQRREEQEAGRKHVTISQFKEQMAKIVSSTELPRPHSRVHRHRSEETIVVTQKVRRTPGPNWPGMFACCNCGRPIQFIYDPLRTGNPGSPIIDQLTGKCPCGTEFKVIRLRGDAW